MSLVEYDASSSDDEQPNVKLATASKSPASKSREIVTSKPSLDKLINTPRQVTKTGVQIKAPEIPVSDSDDSDNEVAPSKKAKLGPNDTNQPRSGLFAKLPAPVNAPRSGRKPKSEAPLYKFKRDDNQNDRAKPDNKSNSKKNNPGTSDVTKSSAVPSISEIRKRSAAAAAKILSNTSVSKEHNSKTESDDEDQDTGFFSYVETLETPADKQTADARLGLPKVELRKGPINFMELAPEVEYESPQEAIHPISSWSSGIPYETSTSVAESSWNMNVTQNSQEMIRLQGKRNRSEEINFIDFHEEDALKGGKEMLLKTLSEEKGMDRTRVDVPGGMMKKKHQLPYLIQQAKAREVALKNSWAQNRQTKQQTQSKYGW